MTVLTPKISSVLPTCSEAGQGGRKAQSTDFQGKLSVAKKPEGKQRSVNDGFAIYFYTGCGNR